MSFPQLVGSGFARFMFTPPSHGIMRGIRKWAIYQGFYGSCGDPGGAHVAASQPRLTWGYLFEALGERSEDERTSIDKMPGQGRTRIVKGVKRACELASRSAIGMETGTS